MASPALGGLISHAGRVSFGVTVGFTVLSSISIGLRVWAKRRTGRPFGLSDYLIFAAYPFCLAFAVLELLAIIIGDVGLHLEEAVSLSGEVVLERFWKLVFATVFVWVTTTTLVRLSLLHFYFSIFRPSRLFRCLGWTVAILTVLHWLIWVVGISFFCIPTSRFWAKSPKGICGRATRSIPSLCSMSGSIILNFALVVIPMPILWDLKIPIKKKILLTGVFCMGLIVCSFSIARFAVARTVDPQDITYAHCADGMFAYLEASCGVVVASLPTLGHLFHNSSISSDRESARAQYTFPRSTTDGSSRAGPQRPLTVVGSDDVDHDEGSATSKSLDRESSQSGIGVIMVRTDVEIESVLDSEDFDRAVLSTSSTVSSSTRGSTSERSAGLVEG